MINNYSASSVNVVITHRATSVAHVLSGFKADDFISISTPEDIVSEEELRDGEVTRSVKTSKMRTVTFKIDQGSSSNDVLSALYKYDQKNLSSCDGIFTTTVIDSSGRTYLYSSECFLKMPSTQGFGQKSGSRDWILVMVGCDFNIGGNSKLNQEMQDILASLGVSIDEKWKSQ